MRRAIVGLAVVLQAVIWAGSAMAHAYWPKGSDPKSNYAVSAPCYGTSTNCINAGVYYLDRARARLHQPAYRLPANFAKLSPNRQALILTNLDRIRYHLPPVPGLTKGLDKDALRTGVDARTDPNPGGALPYTANWAGPFPNLVFAYEAWMYDDGPGSPNLDCPNRHAPGCWGHRHDVLWEFGAGRTAMGASGVQGKGYAMLIADWYSGYHPRYFYTWKQAKADGAGTHKYVVHKP